jgi:hypothetical protein
MLVFSLLRQTENQCAPSDMALRWWRMLQLAQFHLIQ